MVKTLEKLLHQNQVCSDDDHRLTFDLFMARSNLHLYRFVGGGGGELKSRFFSMYLRLMAETYNV